MFQSALLTRSSVVGAVEHAADRRDVEQEPVAPVVERVEQDAEVVVLPQVRAVAAHVVGDDALRMRVPAPARDVDVLVVEEDPRLRSARRPARLRAAPAG